MAPAVRTPGILAWAAPALAVLLASGGTVLAGSASVRAPAPCPDSPNCVSSLSRDPRRSVRPLRYRGESAEARQVLLDVLRAMPRARLAVVEDDYVRAEFRSFLFRFVDDAEFFFGLEKDILHFRSASRTGYFDFGVNRRRIEEIRRRFLALMTGAEGEK